LDRPVEAYKEMARRRGREVMSAIAAAMPKTVLLSMYSYSYPLRQTLPKTKYILLPAFYDGFLEAMPSGATLVDGYESSYGFKEHRLFLAGYRQIHQEAIKLSAVPELYRQKVKAGFGLWLDNRKQPNYFTSDEFQRAVSSALTVSDGYVWIYSQGPRFFPPSGVEESYIKAMADARTEIKIKGSKQLVPPSELSAEEGG
jgi:hypothetical protein